MTARQAMKALCDSGVAYSQRGLGTFVSGSKQVKTSTELLSFTQETKASGNRPGSRVLAFEEVKADAEVASALHLSPKASVFRLKRVRMSDSVPMSIEECCLSPKLCPKLLDRFDPRTSLYQALSQKYGIRMIAADEVAEASIAHAEEAHLLQIKKGTPVFLLTRVSYANTNQPVEFVRSTYRGDRWKLVSRLTANPDTGKTTVARKPVALPSAEPRTRRKEERGIGNSAGSKTLAHLTYRQEEL
jgi:GntR family transcriptional regulator